MNLRLSCAGLFFAFTLVGMADAATALHSPAADKSAEIQNTLAQAGALVKCLPSVPALRSAALVVLGSDADSFFNAWCASPQFADSPTYLGAVGFLRGILKVNADERSKMLGRAYVEVMGRPPSANDASFWQGRMQSEDKWWYATIHGELTRYINSVNIDERKATIHRAYVSVLGRNASEGDLAYWVGRPQVYRAIFDADRAWLYSPAGAAELPEVVKRARAVKGGRQDPPQLTDTQLATRIAVFTDKKSTFEEMVYWFNH